MPTALKRFRVVGLYDRKNISVEIDSNRLILVGENGSGKSTLANLIYYFLSRQWLRLLEYRFQSIEVLFDNHQFSVSRDQLEKHCRRHEELERMFPPAMLAEVAISHEKTRNYRSDAPVIRRRPSVV